jgi:LuxR family maltose regulon positive regulatory protein
MTDLASSGEPQRIQPLDGYELLSTKFALPRPHSSLVVRDHLLARLDEGLEHKLILVSAPAGYGKSTLMSQWIASRSQRPEGFPAAWVSLDAGDNDPVRFWSYVIAACRAFNPSIGETAFAQLYVARRHSLEIVLTTLINELAQLAGEGVMVLEDYHVITSPQIHESLVYFIEHLPTTLHLLMLTRSDPPLPLARLRAHDDLYELDEADLRFSCEEMCAFLQQALHFPLSAATIARLEARMEGWIAGLHLLALALRGRKDPQELERMLVTFTGGHRHILEYLVADVFSSQPETLQEFLLQTSFLNRLSASLCDTVTSRNDSAEMLEQLERANLFLIPLDDSGLWYRYHALFAEAMQHEARRHLGEAYLQSLYKKASLWFEQHGLLPEAVEVALSARDFTHAAALIGQINGSDGFMSELLTLLRWLKQLPEAVLHAHPDLCLAYAMALLFTQDRSDPATLARIRLPLEMAEYHWQAENNRPKLGEVLALRAQVAWWQGDPLQAFNAAHRALELLPQHEHFWRPSALLSVVQEEEYAGRIDLARRIAHEARATFEATGNPFGVRAALFTLTDASLRRGELHQASRLYGQIFTEAAEDPLDMVVALLGLAALSYEWNELQKADQQVSQALDLGRHHAAEIGKYHAEQIVTIPGSLALARILHARGEPIAAIQMLQELVALAQERNWHYLRREALAELAYHSLAVGDLVATQRWLAAITQQGEDFRLVQQEREALISAHLLIAQGETAQVLALLERWLAKAHNQERLRSELEIRVLLSLAHYTRKDLAQARHVLKEALALALPEGYRRLFLDKGEPLATLLRAVLLDVREEALSAYIRDLLLAFAAPQTTQDVKQQTQPAPALLFEPLSQQEQRVLRLLASGLSNPEIARELVVSVNTVKTQVQSIYRKLNVNSRREAGEAARRLKLL